MGYITEENGRKQSWYGRNLGRFLEAGLFMREANHAAKLLTDAQIRAYKERKKQETAEQLNRELESYGFNWELRK